jgi:predicted small secreted protein
MKHIFASTKVRFFASFVFPMKHILSLLLLVIAIGSLSACHTMKGLGEDISAGGQDLAKSAEKHSN